MDPSRRTLCSGDWATSARLLVAKFRADSARNIGDPAFEELIPSCDHDTRSKLARLLPDEAELEFEPELLALAK
jgi:hypothetical protein